jgi:peptide/nickel transport system substrate-binding protein
MKIKSQGRRVTAAATFMAGAALVAGLTVGIAGGGAASAATKASAAPRNLQRGGVIKFEEGPGTPPNYIFPETTSANQSVYNNSQFINLLYPLVYLPTPGEPTLDYAHSMAYPPVWSNNDTVVTVKLRPYKWSDGKPVTARDMVFYINLGKAEGTSWGNYSGPTQFPYDLKSYTAVNATTFRAVLKSPINPTYFDDNGLDYITPLPQQAWDKTSANGQIGNYDMTASGAAAVLKFLQAQAADTNTYASNPLWKVVDGAWTLKSFGGASSPDVFVPNPKYSGPKPYASEFEEIPFTTTSAQFTSLRAGTSTITYGFVPTEDIPAIPSVQSEGYNITKSPTWGFDYIIPNTKNPQVGPILSQTYMRLVLAHLVDQNTMIKTFMHGFGIPTYGPTPIYPLGNPFVSAAERHNPYPYSVSTAESMLRAHGWTVTPGGTDVCATGGPHGCGAGVSVGEKLSLNLLYSSGSTILQEDTDLFQSDAAQAGVSINPKAELFNTVISQVQPCVLPKDANTPTCNWQLGEYGGISESTYPSGYGLLNTGGAFNAGQFSNSAIDTLIQESTVASTLGPYHAYENLVVKEEPWIWQPVPDNIFATAKNLQGFGLTSEFDGAFGYIEPQFWYFTK